MGFNQYSQQQQQQQQQQPPNQSTASQPKFDHQSFNLIVETEDDNEEDPIPTLTSKKMSRGQRKHKWTNPESTNARRNRFRVTDEEPEHFGDDALPRPPGLQQIAKVNVKGSNSTASSGSNPMMYQEFMKEQYELDRKAKMEVIAQESEGC
ncbi:hypothetical protein Tco_1048023 [Tanacetum coccineum]